MITRVQSKRALEEVSSFWLRVSSYETLLLGAINTNPSYAREITMNGMAPRTNPRWLSASYLAALEKAPRVGSLLFPSRPAHLSQNSKD